jgi:hypothetical protein
MPSPFKIKSDHPSLDDLRKDLEAIGFRLKGVRTRKMKDGLKRYFKIIRVDETKNLTRNGVFKEVESTVREYFPEANMTSGSIDELTVAEWW